MEEWTVVKDKNDNINIGDKLDIILKRLDALEEKQKSLEVILMTNQKLYLNQFGNICETLNKNRSIYTEKFEDNKHELETLKPFIYNMVGKNNDVLNPDMMSRISNILWRKHTNNNQPF
jgi:hypothetical protein